ncbi:copia protein [Tanacetum coccineum]
MYVCPVDGIIYAYSMADMKIPADNVPTEHAPAVAPPTRTDDQILPSSKWVPFGKSKSVLDVQKSQRNPIFSIVVAILKNTNFFRAFTTSSMIPAIYIQQFWDTMCFNSSTGLYNCQLDEQWFNLHKDILRDTLDITPANDNNLFEAPPSSDTVIEYVNTLAYPSTLRNVYAMSVNALYQPWRAIMSMINMCLTGWKGRVFFLATKDETSGILKTFITEIENQLDYKVKVIRSDNGTEFKNSVINQFCEMKGIRREFSVARTPQQNGVAERKNRTLIEAARTMLVDSKLPTTF